MQECFRISFIAQYLAISFYWLSPLQLYHKIDGIKKIQKKSTDIVYLVLYVKFGQLVIFNFF
jgi:hypothetical protein